MATPVSRSSTKEEEAEGDAGTGKAVGDAASAKATFASQLPAVTSGGVIRALHTTFLPVLQSRNIPESESARVPEPDKYWHVIRPVFFLVQESTQRTEERRRKAEGRAVKPEVAGFVVSLGVLAKYVHDFADNDMFRENWKLCLPQFKELIEMGGNIPFDLMSAREKKVRTLMPVFCRIMATYEDKSFVCNAANMFRVALNSPKRADNIIVVTVDANARLDLMLADRNRLRKDVEGHIR